MRPWHRRTPEPSIEQIVALAVNAAGQCAYDKYPCYAEPSIWVRWHDALDGKSGEAGYCDTHAVVLITSRTVTYSSRTFPGYSRRQARRAYRQHRLTGRHSRLPRAVLALAALLRTIR